MIKKRTDITIHNSRSVTEFFNRTLDNFERKFDGFPAIQLTPPSVPALQEESPDYSEYVDEIIDNIAQREIGGFTPPCPDVDVGGCVDAANCFYNDMDSLTEWTTSGTPVSDVGAIRLGASDLIGSTPTNVVGATNIRATVVFKSVSSSVGGQRFNLYLQRNGTFAQYAVATVYVEGSDPWELRLGTSAMSPITLTGDAWEDDVEYVMSLELDTVLATVKAKLYKQSDDEPDWQLSSTTGIDVETARITLITNLDTGSSFDFYANKVTVCANGQSEPVWMDIAANQGESTRIQDENGSAPTATVVTSADAPTDGYGSGTLPGWPIERRQHIYRAEFPNGVAWLRFKPSAYVFTAGSPNLGVGGSGPEPAPPGITTFELFKVEDTTWPRPAVFDPAGVSLGTGEVAWTGSPETTLIDGFPEFQPYVAAEVQVYIKRGETDPGTVEVSPGAPIQYMLPGTGSINWRRIEESPCSGQPTSGTLSRTITDTFEAPTSVRYYTDVWYDDLLAAKGVDYNEVDGAIVPTSTISPDITVRARWVI